MEALGEVKTTTARYECTLYDGTADALEERQEHHTFDETRHQEGGSKESSSSLQRP